MRDEKITHERTVAESCGVALPRTDPAVSTGLRLSAVRAGRVQRYAGARATTFDHILWTPPTP